MLRCYGVTTLESSRVIFEGAINGLGGLLWKFFFGRLVYSHHVLRYDGIYAFHTKQIFTSFMGSLCFSDK